jgi:hypothetical protein
MTSLKSRISPTGSPTGHTRDTTNILNRSIDLPSITNNFRIVHQTNPVMQSMEMPKTTKNATKMDNLKFELSLLNQPVGKTIAENVIKKNNHNYEKYYPEKAKKYTEKDFRYSEKLINEESP